MRRAQRWMFGALVAGILGFGLVAWDDALKGPLYEQDARVNDAVSGWQAAGFPAHTVGGWLTQMGNTWTVTAVTAVAVLWMWAKGERILAMWAAAISLATGGVVAILKAVFQRARPALAGNASHGYSFPSGHTLAAIAAVGSTIILVTETHRRTRGTGPHRLTVRQLWAVALGLALLIAALTGTGRVLAQAHWVSDVVASWCLGLALGGGLLLWLSRAAPAGEDGPHIGPPAPAAAAPAADASGP